MAGYIFGGTTGETPESLARQRQIADALWAQQMGQGRPKKIGDGIALIGQALAHRLGAQALDKRQSEGRSAGNDAFNQAISLFGGEAAPDTTQPNPAAGYRPGDVTAAPLGDDRDLLIRTIAGEAGGEPPEGQAAVAAVINNRLKSGDYGKSIHDVIMAPKQFSLWNKGDPAGDLARRLDPNSPQYQAIAQIVDGVASGQTPDPTGGALNYYNPRVASPNWGDVLAKQNDVTIGNHRFVGQMGQPRPSSAMAPQDLAVGESTTAFAPQGGMQPFADSQTAPQPVADRGGSSLRKLMEAASNPWLSDGQRMVVGALLKRQMEMSDPSYALDSEYKRAQIDALKNKAAGAGNEYGLNPIWGTDANGNPSLIQLGKGGTPVQPQLPNGFKIARDPIRIDAGTQTILLDPQTRQPIGSIPIDNRGAARETASGKVEGETSASAVAGLPDALAKAQNVLNTIQSVEDDPGRERGTGASSIFNIIPATKGYDFSQKVNQLKGQAFLEAFQQLRGGGAITEIEGAKATDAIARLSTGQSEEAFSTALKDLRDVVETGIKRMKAKAGITEPPAATSTAPRPGETQDGYRFRGGNPADPNNWEPAQ